MLDEAPGDDVADFAHQGIVLKHFAGNVQGQVFAVHHAVQEAEPFRQQAFRLGVNQHALAVQGHVGVHAAEPEHFRIAPGDEKQGIQGNRGVRAEVHVGQGLFIRMGDELVKLVIFLRLHVGFGLGPDGLDGVDVFSVEVEGEPHEVGVAAQEFLDAVFLGEFFIFVFQADDDAGAPVQRFRQRFDAVAFPSVGRPAQGGGFRFIGAGEHFHAVRHHERAVETHAELADQVRSAFLLLLKGFHEFFGAGVGDGSQVFHQVRFRHPDAGIRDGDGFVFLIRGYGDFQGLVRLVNIGVRQLLQAQFFQGVGSVGDKFADKDFTVAVKGVDDNVQQLPDFRLKLMCFCIHMEKCFASVIIRPPSRGMDSFSPWA